MPTQPGFGLGNARHLVATGQAAVNTHQFRLPRHRHRWHPAQFQSVSAPRLPHSGSERPGRRQRNAIAALLIRPRPQISREVPEIIRPPGDIGQMRLRSISRTTSTGSASRLTSWRASLSTPSQSPLPCRARNSSRSAAI
jgi:hypothetical protein